MSEVRVILKNVELFVCLSLLLSACSPDKPSKASSKANEFARNTEVEKVKMTEREKETRDVPSPTITFCDKHKWCSVPRDTWGTITSDREIGKVGGFSITPKKILWFVLVVGGICAVAYGWHKLKQQSLKLAIQTQTLFRFSLPRSFLPSTPPRSSVCSLTLPSFYVSSYRTSCGSSMILENDMSMHPPYFLPSTSSSSSESSSKRMYLSF
ncbi:MAG: hypothetical protein LE178_01950 [Endomicrobium sp.]|nr:hypothetical protein [Endomicrobium sp.]